MGKNILAAFRPVKFEYGKIHMSGGFTTKQSAMKSKIVQDENCKNICEDVINGGVVGVFNHGALS